MNKNIDWRANLTIAGVSSALVFIGATMYCTYIDFLFNTKEMN